MFCEQKGLEEVHQFSVKDVKFFIIIINTLQSFSHESMPLAPGDTAELFHYFSDPQRNGQVYPQVFQFSILYGGHVSQVQDFLKTFLLEWMTVQPSSWPLTAEFLLQ